MSFRPLVDPPPLVNPLLVPSCPLPAPGPLCPLASVPGSVLDSILFLLATKCRALLLELLKQIPSNPTTFPIPYTLVLAVPPMF